MLSHTIRNLLIFCFTIVIILVLGIVFFTFSTLRSQEIELGKISQSREILKLTGLSVVDMQRLESLRANHIITTNTPSQEDYNSLIAKLQEDSTVFVGLAVTDTGNAEAYKNFATLIHEMIVYSTESIYGPHDHAGTINNEKGIPIIEKYNYAIKRLEDKKREILIVSYDRTLFLTRKTKSYAIIVAFIIAGVLITGFYVIYNHIKTTKEIEAGIYNSERKKTQQELIEAEHKFRSLVEQSLTGVYIIQEGKFVYVNPRFAQIFGYTQKELINSGPGAVIMPEDQAMVLENVRARIAGEKESVHYEANGKKKNGEEIRIEVFCSGTLYVGSSAIIGTLLDITERKKAEEEIIRANERFNLIARATNDAVWDWDMIKDRNWGNDVFYKYYGTKPDDPSNYETFLSRVHPDDKQRLIDRLQKGIQKKADVILDEFRFRMPDGHYRNFYDRAYLIYNKEGMPVRMLGSMMDITEKHLLEKEIVNQQIQAQKMITRAVLKAEETERNKIGQELHDNVNQILVSIKMFLSMTRTRDAEAALKLVQNSSELIDNAIHEIRLLSQSHVTPLKELNLEDLIQSLMDKLREGSLLKTNLVYNVNGHLIHDELKINIYRIVQEQISNIVKHAAASIVKISVITDAEFLHVAIEDDGKGFDTSAKRKGIGISNMINRVESFNGELIIESSAGNGCKVNIRIPSES